MVLRIDWRSVAIAVVAMLVVGFVVGALINMVTTSMLMTYARENSVASAGAFMLGVNSVVACLQGLIYGAVIGAAYAWLASRRESLEAGDALVGAAITALAYLVLATILGLCTTTMGMAWTYQAEGIQVDPENLGSLAFGILSGVLLHTVIEGIALLIAALPTAMLVARGRR